MFEKIGDHDVRIALGTLHGLEIYAVLDEREADIFESVNLMDLSKAIREKIKGRAEHVEAQKRSLVRFTDDLASDFEISRRSFYDLLAMKSSVLHRRPISHREFMRALLLIPTVRELKEICHDHALKGYSQLNKDELIDFIADSLSDQEIRDFLRTRETAILERETEEAVRILQKQSSERLTDVKIVNKDRNEIEMTFQEREWEIGNFLSLTNETMDQPEFDCDCRIGANQGFCRHFWVAFLTLARHERFNPERWRLTALPENVRSFLNLP